MAIRIIDPIREGEFANDADLKLPSGAVKICGIDHGDGIIADFDDGVAKDFARFRRQSFEEFDDLNGNQKPIVHGLGFETLIEFFERDPTLWLVVVDLTGHSDLVIFDLLMSQRDKEGGQTFPFFDWQGLNLQFNFLNAHG